MNDFQRPPLSAEENEQLNRRRSARAGTEAVEDALFGRAPSTAEVVELAMYVKGRLIHTKTDDATIRRIMAILTGLES
jgi:hypothetical protein